jgi:hypothetical protein
METQRPTLILTQNKLAELMSNCVITTTRISLLLSLQFQRKA